MIPLLRFVNAAKPPSYQRVLELDKQFRSAALPLMDDAESTSISASMRWWVRAHYIDLSRFTFHLIYYIEPYRMILDSFDVLASRFLRSGACHTPRESTSKSICSFIRYCVPLCLSFYTNDSVSIWETTSTHDTRVANLDIYSLGRGM